MEGGADGSGARIRAGTTAATIGRAEASALGRALRSGWCVVRFGEGVVEIGVRRKAFDACAGIVGAEGGCETAEARKAANAVAATLRAAAGADGRRTARSDASAGAGFDLREIFDAVKPSAARCPAYEETHDALLPTPRAYQRQACAWMLARERAANAPVGALEAKRERPFDASGELHPLWRELPRGGGYVNPYAGVFSKTRFEAQHENVSGGILADEMGLGKTVEIIMLVLANPEPTRARRRADAVRAALDAPVESNGAPARHHNCRIAASEGCDVVDVKTEIKTEIKAEEGEIEPSEDETRAEVVRCPCGARESDPTFNGLWVECEKCETWMHARCVGLCTNASREQRLMKMSQEEREFALSGFTCGRCIAEHASATVDETCGATLVVCPSAIIQQWRDEVENHVRPGSLKIIAYEGQSNKSAAGGLMKGVYSANDLAEADLVFTTYDTLQAEINIDTANGDGLTYAERSRRFARKYEVVPTPLTRLKWWRVVLDEAQMVESVVSKAAIMVRRLPAVHRWAVTGTPISRGLGDLFGLLTFLMVSPFAYGDFWWRRMIEEPYLNGDARARELLHSMLKGIMWRNSRADMEKQLGVPPQGEVTSWLRSNAVESHWYARQYADCSLHANATLDKYKQQSDDTHIDPHKAASVMGPLLRLRQACDHPQAGSHGLAGGIRSGANVLSMDQISEKLIERARLEATEAQRLVAFTLNALAGIAWIHGNYVFIISAYRDILKLEDEGQKKNIRLDSLQRLHALHNLHLALAAVKADPELLKGAKIAPTVRDDSLETDAKTEREKYIAQRAGGVQNATKEVESATSAVEKQLQLCHLRRVDEPTWWSFVLDHAMSTSDGASNLLARVYQAFDGRWQEKQAPFRDVAGLRLTMLENLQQIQSTREEVMVAIADLTNRSKAADEEEVSAIGRCEKCRKDTDFATPGVRCMFCKCEPLLERFESMIFGVRLRVQVNQQRAPGSDENAGEEEVFVPRVTRFGRTTGERQEDNTRGGASAVETVLRMILPARNWWSDKTPDKKTALQHHTESKAHVAALEEMRKEFYKISQLIVQQREEMAARDEIDMCVRRIRIRQPQEMPYYRQHVDARGYMTNRFVDPIPEALRGSIIFKDEAASLNVSYSQQNTVYQADLRKALSQLSYLESTLRAKEDQQTAMDCPICLSSFSDVGTTNACVFTCGHRTCLTCALDVVRRARSSAESRVSCVTCRHRSYIDELMYVNNAGNRGGVSSKADYARRGKGGEVKFLTDLLGDEDEMFEHEQKITVSGSWGTKIEAVVRRVKFLLTRDENTKILIFSEWDDVLNVVEKAIEANEVVFTRAEAGSKFRVAVDKFKHDPSVNALLLPLKRGAHGLNLTEAQHVVLLEPVLDPGLEAQAIKRVDRIGQTQPTCVHRFIIRDTVEENVYKFSTERANAMNDLASDRSLQKKGKDDGLTLGEIRALLSRPSDFNNMMTHMSSHAEMTNETIQLDE